MVKDPTLYFNQILEAIKNIEEDIAGLNCSQFNDNRRACQLSERNLEIISEASRKIPDPLKELESGIPWSDIAGIGNILRHEYAKIEHTILWNTCKKDLPPLKSAIGRLQAEHKRRNKLE